MTWLGNSYVLGLLIVLSEILSNLILQSFGLAGTISFTLLFAFIAGTLYAKYNNGSMPVSEKVKCILTYAVIEMVLTIPVAISTGSPWTVLAFAAIYLVLYVIGIYAFLTSGSAVYVRNTKTRNLTPGGPGQ